ncbi:MAG: Hydrogenase maturation protease, partial [Myxococcaceae bacterium]|nr:Hydrogenase maturation protease [Myxococcaceae bacterium]
MSARVLVAGIGNVFNGDDGFGVAVARRLVQEAKLPPSVVVRDVGIRGLHLAYELLDPWDMLIVIDAVARGGPPGTLHLIEPSTNLADVTRAHDVHGMDLRSILLMAGALGAATPMVRLVGCDVADVSEKMGMTAEVEAAIPEAVRMIEALVRQAMKGAKVAV